MITGCSLGDSLASCRWSREFGVNGPMSASPLDAEDNDSDGRGWDFNNDDGAAGWAARR